MAGEWAGTEWAGAETTGPGRAGVSPVLASPAPAPVERPETQTDGDVDQPWLTVVWDDPVNLMSYVTWVFQRVFGYSREQAHELMLRVHNDGRAVVSSGGRDKVENDVRKLQEAGLWATMQREL